MIFGPISAAVLLGLSPIALHESAEGYLVCSATPTRAGSNRVALLNLSYGDEARIEALTSEFGNWLRSDATVAKDIEGAGIDPRLVRAQSKVECVEAKDQSAAEAIAKRLADRLRADNVKVLPTNWTPKDEPASSN
ncbi:MAG: hypothetical protein EON93_10775 [Burkholderiales bacterium]|nr:MAG: hypothetical protein EON93_10775 [Burkholderiales bacterium]